MNQLRTSLGEKTSFLSQVLNSKWENALKALRVVGVAQW